MLRQSVNKCNSIARLALSRTYNTKPPCGLCPEDKDTKNEKAEDYDEKSTDTNNNQMCKEHCEMMPDAKDLVNMKSFELKSNCKSFHWCSEGHDR
ncbi:unnamed protein product [Chironomus riparius]|uniref:Uncharacterized protein n=1 Tax=Chironomus riparius TaxID=315576 RepID=A0A9N9WWW7_9DIPT|nr:unnamed protein product [Chironomus riparius]